MGPAERSPTENSRIVGRWWDCAPLVPPYPLVCDNLKTHDIASLYAAFPADEAYRLRERLEIHHTPSSGSWLNVAEIDLAAFSRQCLDRRIGSAAELAQEVNAWQDTRNANGSTVKWRFTTADTRIRLRHFYPQL